MDIGGWLKIEAARKKVNVLPEVLSSFAAGTMPSQPGRDAKVLSIKEHPPKSGLQSREGQGRLLHDLANVELQAMELCMLTLAEFPDAPKDFRDELADVALEESRHFVLCLDALDELGMPWGSWPIHMALWDAARPQAKNESRQPEKSLERQQKHDLLDRVLVVHRFMEGSGLDAGSRILTRLTGTKATLVREVVGTIVREEIGHVAFGGRWYRALCNEQRIDASEYFRIQYPKILKRIPRTEKPDLELRKQAGFDDAELAIIDAAYRATDFSIPLALRDQMTRISNSSV